MKSKHHLKLILTLASFLSLQSLVAQNWSWSDATSGRSVANGVEVSDNGITGGNDHYYLTGAYDPQFEFMNSPTFSSTWIGGTIPVGVAGPEAFLAQYSTNASGIGVVNWVAAVTSAAAPESGQGFEAGRKIAIDRNGNVYVLGVFNSATIKIYDASASPIFSINKYDMSSPDEDLYVIKYDNTGTPLWAHRVSTSNGDMAGDIEVTSTHVYVTGAVSGQDVVTSSHGAPASTVTWNANWSAPDYDIIMVKIDVFTGQIVDGLLMGDDDNDYGIRLTVPAWSSDVYLTGSFEGSLTHTDNGNSTTDISNGGLDFFACKFNAGNIHSQTVFTAGGTGDDEGLGISINPNTLRVHVSGYFENTVSFPGITGSTTSNGLKDGFLGKINGAFSGFDWIHTAGNSLGAVNDQFNSLDVDHCGFIYHSHLVGGDPNIRLRFDQGFNYPPNSTYNYHTAIYKYQDGLTAPTALWNHHFTLSGNSNYNGCMDLAVSAHSVHGPDVYYAGRFEKELTFPWTLQTGGSGGPSVTITSDFQTTCAGGCPHGAFFFHVDDGPSFAPTNYGPYCLTDPPIQLTSPVIPSTTLGATYPPGTVPGTWSGTGVSSSGLFTPANAGIGSHLVSFSVNYGDCQLGSNIATIDVEEDDWPKQPTTSNSNSWADGRCAAIDNDGYYMAGRYRHSATFNQYSGGSISISATSNSTDGYLVRYDDCGADWAFGFGSGANNEDASTVRYRAANDKIYLGGNIRGPLSSGLLGAVGPAITTSVNGVTLSNTSITRKGFIAQVEPSTGQVDWVYVIGDNPGERSTFQNFKIGSNGNLFVLSDTYGNMTTGSSTHTPSNSLADMMVLELSPAGAAMNVDFFGTSGADGMRSLTFTEDGWGKYYLVTTGYVHSSTGGTFASGPIPITAGNQRDVFLAVYDITLGSLTQSYINVFGGTFDDEGRDLEARPPQSPDDPTADYIVFLSGMYEGSFLYNPYGNGNYTTPTTVNGNERAFVMGMDFNLDPKWLDHAGGNSSGNRSLGRQLLLANGKLQAVGRFQGSTAPGFLTGISAVSGYDLFVGNFDYDGTSANFSSVVGSGPDDRCNDIEVKGADLYMCGSFGGNNTVGQTAAFNGTPLSSNSPRRDAYFARRSNTGVFFDVYDPDASVGIGEFPVEPIEISELEISVYPNPSKGQFWLDGLSDKQALLTVRDYTGRTVATRIEQGVAPMVDLSGHPDGMYLLEIAFPNGQKTLKRLVIE